MTLDDVPLGLSLQPYAPFKFSCRRLWMKPIEDVGFKVCNLGLILDKAASISNKRNNGYTALVHLKSCYLYRCNNQF